MAPVSDTLEYQLQPDGTMKIIFAYPLPSPPSRRDDLIANLVDMRSLLAEEIARLQRESYNGRITVQGTRKQ